MEYETGFDDIVDRMIKKYIQNIGESVENEVFSPKIKLNSDFLKEDKDDKDKKHKRKKKKCC